MDNFFHKNILLCDKNHYLSAYCARSVTSNEIVAIFTLANDTLNLFSEEFEDFLEETSYNINDEYKNIYRQQSLFPAINIGHLGVKQGFQGKGIGQKILTFIIITFESYNATGCQFVTVDSLNNPLTNKFYAQNGFQNLTDRDFTNDTRRMFLYLHSYTDGI